ncbi:DGQHR domain-containing protein [Kosakonia cowanii]|uniref:DGQHR domain-containing protein n=1 Tax=Kosakonia TaxID=1330547 RepID=UPI00190DAA3F|nr:MULTISPECIES: DGQHR domain-containing protein [Kosakonia]MBK0015198.1 DGQHR domain-containing protein [Kosakonia sp. S42]UGS44474.1 DGQHR domain-containing protein [Kosakonia cowanii]
MSKIETTAINLTKGDIKFFLTSLTTNELMSTCKISRVNEKAEQGFQRTLDTARASKIAKYLNDGKVIPGALILSCQRDSDVEYDEKTQKLIITRSEGLFMVIDGQHRLYGSYIAYKEDDKTRIPVCILSGLNRQEEIEYFIDINSNQKGVPKTLRIELTKYLVEEGSLEGIRLKLFDDLSDNLDSPLSGRLSASQKGRGYITHVPFQAALDRVLQISPLKDLPYDDKLILIKNYLFGVKVNLVEVGSQEKLFQATFFQSIFRVFEQACSIAMTIGSNYKKETFVSLFNVLQKINYELHSGTNDQAITALEKDISALLDIEVKIKISNRNLF